MDYSRKFRLFFIFSFFMAYSPKAIRQKASAFAEAL